MTPFDSNGILTSAQLAASWVRMYVKNPVSVLTTTFQRLGLPLLVFRCEFDANGTLQHRELWRRAQ